MSEPRTGGALFSPRVRPALRRADPVARLSGIQGRVASGTMNGKWGERLLIDLWSAVII
jgi:hypothetical protein